MFLFVKLLHPFSRRQQIAFQDYVSRAANWLKIQRQACQTRQMFGQVGQLTAVS